MTTLKLSSVRKSATLLKKLIEKADTNKDGAIRTREIDSIASPNPRIPTTPQQSDLRSALHGVQRYAMSKGSVAVPDLKKTVDEFAKRVKAADKDQDGVLSEAEYRALASLGEKRFVDFASRQSDAKVSDFKLEPQRAPSAPRFSWSGTPQQVCSSLLNAYSNPRNDNFWPSWGSPDKGASRYVLTKTEATKMVDALKPLYASRQKSVLKELSARTERSAFGCVSCDAGAKAVFAAYAKDLGVQGLKFLSPAAPRMPAP